MSQIKCPYCGNNQVPHFLHWYSESLNILFTPIRQLILYNPVTKFLKNKKIGQDFNLLFLSLAESFKIITRNSHINKCKVRRAEVLWEEAEKRGWKMEEFLFFGKGIDSYILNRKESAVNIKDNKQSSFILSSSSIVFTGLPRPLDYYNPKLDLMDDKAWFKKEMKKNNLPTPFGGAVTSFRQAKKIYEQVKQNEVGASLIVKPRSGSRGRHSTTYVNNFEELNSAYKIAKQLCYWVVVEQQLFGPVYRATVIDYKLKGLLRGDSPQVIGDGVSNLAKLIEQKNKDKINGVKDFIYKQETEEFIKKQLKTKASNFSNLQTYIPEKNQVLFLSEKIGVGYGGSSSEDLEICHPDNREIFETAAKVLKDPILGFDFIIPDISKSYKEQLSGFIEVNTLPFINLHHDPLLGKPKNIAASVWDMFLKS